MHVIIIQAARHATQRLDPRAPSAGHRWTVVAPAAYELVVPDQQSTMPSSSSSSHHAVYEDVDDVPAALYGAPLPRPQVPMTRPHLRLYDHVLDTDMPEA